jgi:hypothetical protein
MTIQDLGSLGELVAAIATVATLGYLGLQIRTSNRLARAEASRSPNSDLNSINGAFGTNPAFLAALRRVLEGAERSMLEPLDRTLMDMYLLSVTNLQEQLLREVRAGIVGEDALDFGGAGLFLLPYYRTSWPIYRNYLTSAFVAQFEQRYALDPSIEAVV